MARVNRTIDTIVADVTQPLNLEGLARVACFSPCHFHRVFRSLMGETLKPFVKRVRLEKALTMMRHHDAPTLTGVTLAGAFAALSDFSRSFKQRYGVPPSVNDLQTFRDQRRKELFATEGAQLLLLRLPRGENPDGFSAQIRSLPARRVAYIRGLPLRRRGGCRRCGARRRSRSVRLFPR